MSLSRRRSREESTPLGDLAAAHGLLLATRTWMERTVADVAFDSYAFGHDLLCDSADADERRAALERGWRADGAVLAVGSLPFHSTPIAWFAAQSRRGANHLGLDLGLDLDPDRDGAPGDHTVGHARFDERFVLDVDDDAMKVVRAIVTDELCEWAVSADDEHGPLTVIFDGAETGNRDRPGHGAAVFIARQVDDDESFVATLALTRHLVDGFHAALSD